jgi:hypothetical protein
MRLTSNGGVFSVWLSADLRTRLFALARPSKTGASTAGEIARTILADGIRHLEEEREHRRHPQADQ